MAGGHAATGDEPLVAPELARVQPNEVADILKAQSSAEKPAALILDVRDPKEVEEGRIKGSVNVPSAVFKSEDKTQLDEVIRSQLAGSGAKEVIVHCHFSKVRGPTCAKALHDRIKELGLEGAPEVKVLAGGVAGFIETVGSSEGGGALVELPEGGWNPAQK